MEISLITNRDLWRVFNSKVMEKCGGRQYRIRRESSGKAWVCREESGDRQVVVGVCDYIPESGLYTASRGRLMASLYGAMIDVIGYDMPDVVEDAVTERPSVRPSETVFP